MTKRCLVVAIVFALCICLALGVLALLPPRPGVTKANFDRIEVGMTETQLEQLLGRKSERSINAEKMMRRLAWSESERYFVWTGVNGTAMIRIDRNGCVVTPEWQDRDPTFFQQFRSRLPF